MSNPVLGVGGAPTRETTLPEAAVERKQYPVASGVLDYFPDAIVALAHVSWQGNEQHNPGQSLHWARGKSADEGDALMRHFLRRGTRDRDTIRHSAKMAWRALALLQKEIELEGGAAVVREIAEAEQALQSAPVEFTGPESVNNYVQQRYKRNALLGQTVKAGPRVGRACPIDALACYRPGCVEDCQAMPAPIKKACPAAGVEGYVAGCWSCREANGERL